MPNQQKSGKAGEKMADIFEKRFLEKMILNMR
jgi:hypothetical protein